jgi:hypothetical protein
VLFDQFGGEFCIDMSVARLGCAPAEESFPVHCAIFLTPRLPCRAGVCQPCAFRLLKLGDDIGAGTIPADDEVVPEFGSRVDADVVRAHRLASKIVNGGLHCVFSF